MDMPQFDIDFIVTAVVRTRRVAARTAQEAANLAWTMFDMSAAVGREFSRGSSSVHLECTRWDASAPVKINVKPRDMDPQPESFEIDANGIAQPDTLEKAISGKLEICVRNGEIRSVHSTNRAVTEAIILNEDVLPELVNEVVSGEQIFDRKGNGDEIANKMPVRFDPTLTCWTAYREHLALLLEQVGWFKTAKDTDVEIVGGSDWWSATKEDLPRGPKQLTETEIAKAKQAEKQAELDKIDEQKRKIVKAFRDAADTRSRQRQQERERDQAALAAQVERHRRQRERQEALAEIGPDGDTQTEEQRNSDRDLALAQRLSATFQRESASRDDSEVEF
jgi:hypothetical protein